MLTGLPDASHLITLKRLPELVAEYGAQADLGGALIYLADLQQTVLCLLAAPGCPALAAEGQIAELRSMPPWLPPEKPGGGRSMMVVTRFTSRKSDGLGWPT